MAGPADLYDACMALLVDAVDALSLTDAGTPPLALVYPGPPPADECNMVTVHWSTITHGTAPGEATFDAYHRTNVWLNLVVFTITSFRCDGKIPNGKTHPNPSDIALAAKRVADDAWALNSYISRQVKRGQLFGPFPCNEILIGPAQQLTGLGGIVGCTMTIAADIPGFDS